MQTIQFNSTIKCSGCVAKVKESLNQIVGENNWSVDLDDPQKTLSIRSENANTEKLEILIQQKGFKIEKKLTDPHLSNQTDL